MKPNKTKNVVSLILAFLCATYLLAVSSDGQTDATPRPSIDDYPTLADCLATYVLGRPGIALQCYMPLVNYHTDNVDFSVIPSEYTLSLDITCTMPFGWGSSSFENVSLTHLKELLQLTFTNCDFPVLPGSSPLPDNLNYLSFQLGYAGVVPLEVQRGALSNLPWITVLEITSFNIATLPSNELCHLHNLVSLNLSHNSLADVRLLGFASCGEELLSLDISFNKFETIGDGSFTKLVNLKYLFLRSNVIRAVGTSAFLNLSSLIHLDLSHNSLSEVHPNALMHLTELLILNVSHNRLAGDMSVDTFKHLDKLVTLDLSHNVLHSVSTGTFDHMIHLAELFLSSNRIQAVADQTFSSLVNLNILDISDNLLPNLTSMSLSGLQNLVTLYLKDNVMLNAIHEDAFLSCPRLCNLSISNCSLTSVPKLNHLKDLQILDLSTNEISKINNDTFSQMFQLILVKLKNNNIFYVEEKSFHDNVELLVLMLAQNQLHFLPIDVVQKNSKLFYLDASENYLRYVPNLQVNSQLVHVNLSDNQITKLDYGLLPKSLSVLDLSRNRVQSVEEKFLAADDVQLNFLYMSHNQLERINRTTFSKSTKVLQLSENHVSYIESRAFFHMPDLMIVDLSHNRLVTLASDALQVRASSKLNRPRFFLEGNFLNCDCTTKWLKTINEDLNGLNYLQLYGIVYDLATLYCWTPVIGGERHRRSISQLIRTPEEKFLCTFEEYTFSDPFCYRVAANKTICELVCPAAACDCYRDFSWSNIFVDCSRANLTRVPSDIPIGVKSLYLDGNSIRQLTLPDLPFLTHLYLNDTELTGLTRDVFAGTPRLEELHLERNALRELEVGTFDGLSSLKLLDMSSNALSRLQENVFRPLTSLKILRLADNGLVSFPVWTLSQVTPRLTEMSLSRNPWSCDCDYMKSYRDWLQGFAHIVTDVDNLFCMPTDNVTSSIPLIAFNASHCFNSSIAIWKLDDNNHLPLFVGLISTFMTISLLSVLIYAYRKEMQVLVYSRYHVRLFNRNTDDDDDPGKVYDAFVSYSSLDETFVVQELLPKLEITLEIPYKICLHHRNFLAGAFIMDSIMEAVDKSRRTILLLSENFIQSEWCRFEFKSAHLQMLKDRRNRVIVIVLGKIPDRLDPEMKLYMKTNTYLQWGDRLFWEKLYFALPELRKPAT